MKFLTEFFALLDVAPDPPFTFGATGKGIGVAFGLFLSALAIAFFLLFRRRLSSKTRSIAAAVLLLFAIGGAAAIWAAFAHYDAEAIRNQPVYHGNPRRPIIVEDDDIPPAPNTNAQNNINAQKNINSAENKPQKSNSGK